MTAAAHTTYHLRPAVGGWLNDPNGMTKVGDTWHVFYQHNAAGPWHEAIAWGHASSRDLAVWQHHPIAFSPTPGGPDAFGCWSGCFVPGGDRPAVAYSGLRDATLRSTVCLRHGSEDLVTWGEPVVVAETPDADDIAVMRDPVVFEAGGRPWALLGGGRRDGVPVVLLFSRDDEAAWTYEGLFATGTDPALDAADTADIWECPQLLRMDGRWVLLLSLQYRTVLGRVVAAVGDLEWDGGRPRFAAERLNVIDGGGDFYAPQVVDVDGAPLLFGWIRQADQDPAVTDHAGCLTLPRRLALRDGVVTSAVDPVAARALAGDARPLAPGPVPPGEARPLAPGPVPPADDRPSSAVVPLGGRHARLTVEDDGARLRHAELGEVAVPAGAEIWVDGPVLELYPPGGVPATWRSEDPWDLEVPDGVGVTVSEVAASTVSGAAPSSP